MVAEVVHGAPYRFRDPARFSLAHGGKDRHPYPVPIKVYDETIRVMKSAVQKAKLGRDEEMQALKRLDDQARRLERTAEGPSFEAFVATERAASPAMDGRSVFGLEKDLTRPRRRGRREADEGRPRHELEALAAPIRRSPILPSPSLAGECQGPATYLFGRNKSESFGLRKVCRTRRWINKDANELQLVYRRDPGTGQPVEGLLRWGLIPHFCEMRPDLAPIHARAETVAEKEWFRDAGRKDLSRQELSKC